MAELTVQVSPLTFEEAARLDPDRQAGELVEGEWSPVSRNTWRHGEIVLNVGLLLRFYARQHPGWSIAAGDPGTKLSRNPDTLRGPDVGVIREERRPVGRGAEGWLDGAPDLVVEVRGDDQGMTELLAKAQEYLAAGARMVWLLDPADERVVVVTPPTQFQVASAEDALEGGDVLPGFSCKVSELFE